MNIMQKDHNILHTNKMFLDVEEITNRNLSEYRHRQLRLYSVSLIDFSQFRKIRKKSRILEISFLYQQYCLKLKFKYLYTEKADLNLKQDTTDTNDKGPNELQILKIIQHIYFIIFFLCLKQFFKTLLCITVLLPKC